MRGAMRRVAGLAPLRLYHFMFEDERTLLVAVTFETNRVLLRAGSQLTR